MRFATPPSAKRLRGSNASPAIEASLLLSAYWLHGSAANLDGVGLLAPFTLALIVATLLRDGASTGAPSTALTLGHALLLLAPSALVANAAMASYALCLAVCSRPPARNAALCAAALALTALWSSLGRNLAAPPLLEADAIGVQALLDLFGDGASRSGNRVSPTSGQPIIIFADCATAFLLPGALTASAAMALGDGRRLGRRFTLALAILAAALTLANLSRLAILAISADAYELGHGPLGRNLFDALCVGMAALAATLGKQSSERPSPPIASLRMPPRAGTMTAAMLAIIVIGFGIKGWRYGAAAPPTDEAADLRLAAFLGEEGWRYEDRRELIAGTGYAVMIFAKPGCAAPILASQISSTAESVDAIRVALPGSGFLYAGEISAAPSRRLALSLWLKAAASSAGLAARPMPALAIMPLPTDQDSRCAPPPIARWKDLAAL